MLIFSSSGTGLEDPSDSTFRDAVARTTQVIRDMPEIKGVDSFLSTGSRRFLAADGKTTYAVVKYGVSEQLAVTLRPIFATRSPISRLPSEPSS